MMFWQAIGAARDLSRAGHRRGADPLRFWRHGAAPRHGRRIGQRPGKVLHWHVSDGSRASSRPRGQCRALEDLGPTFIKLGQILATGSTSSLRVDRRVLPLQDAAPAGALRTGRAQLVEDLGRRRRPPSPRFETTPLAAASLAQVYRARLTDGREVVLKVAARNPSDGRNRLRLLARLAEIVNAEMPELRRYRPARSGEGVHLARRELDFGAECRSAERIAGTLRATGVRDPRDPLAMERRAAHLRRISSTASRAATSPPVDAAGMDRRLLRPAARRRY